MASSADVHVRICAQEIIKYDLEIKAAIQVTTRSSIVNYLVLASVFFFDIYVMKRLKIVQKSD